jgi:hypothetical protein
MKFTTWITLDEDFNEMDIEVEVTYSLENTGIGGYEYWGSKEFDKGQDYIEIEDIEVLNIEDMELLFRINRFIDNNWDYYSKQIEEDILEYYQDERDRFYER